MVVKNRQGNLSPRKKEHVKVLLEHNAQKIVEIAKTLNTSTPTIGQTKKKLRNNEDLEAKRAGKCGKKRKTTHKLERKIVKMCLSNRTSSSRKNLSGLAAEGFVVHKRTVNRRFCEVGLKAYILGCCRRPDFYQFC